MRLTLRSALFLLLAASAAGEEEGSIPSSGTPLLPSAATRKLPGTPGAIVAEVDTARLTRGQVYELWAPAWQENAALVRQRKIDAAEGDRRLQEAWEKALETVVREEVFHQEAKREFERMIQERATQLWNAQQAQGPNGPEMSRAQIEAEIRQRITRAVERQMQDIIDRTIKASGGADRLKAAIVGRGLTWEEWKERLRRKAVTNAFLYESLAPLVSRNPRPSDVRDYYRDHAGEFVEPGAVRFRHILFATEARGGEDAARSAAESVFGAISAGRLTFEQAAAKHSDDPVSRAKDGLETGFAIEPEREAWLRDVRDAVRREKPGEIGPILVSPRGCHLVQLLAAEAGRPIPFARAQKEISEAIFARAWEAESLKLYESLQTKVRVHKTEPRFPPDLSCARIGQEKRARLVQVGPAAAPGAVEADPAPASPAAPAPAATDAPPADGPEVPPLGADEELR